MGDLLLAGAVVTVYALLLVGAALWAERREARGRSVAANRYVYALALGVYTTTWTFYGSVGYAARHGLLFLTVYLGPTLCAVGWWWLVRKLVRLKGAHRVTSLPDVLALRYEKSQGVALLASAVLVVGLIPYVALQLKTMIVTLGLVTAPARFVYPASGWQLGAPLLLFLVLFTIAFGLRRVRPTERHPGMMFALAVESVVKLVAFLAAGAFVVWSLFDGPRDVFRAAAASSVGAPDLLGRHGVGAWLAHLFLGGAAVLLLPRQFHVAVVENADEDHVRTASWLFPAYLLLINVFVLPVALGGLALRGSDALADTFVLALPLQSGVPALSWLVFLGGFSAGIGMVVVETTALATILSNHVAVPAAEAWRVLGGLRRHVLPVRWVAAAAVLLAAFGYERAFGPAYDLASIGLISFVAVLQLGPALVGGLFWNGASRAGALAGIAAGFATWSYTLVIPVLARGGWLPSSLLAGPFGIENLAPEALFALHADRITHAVVWTLVANVGAYVAGSLLVPSRHEERARAERLVAVLGLAPGPAAAPGPGASAKVRAKRERTVALLGTYHPPADAVALADDCLTGLGAGCGGDDLVALEVAAFEARVERTLAATIGAAAAHAAVRRAELVTPDEAQAISTAYGELLAGLHLSPEELLRKLDYHLERERLLSRDAADQQYLAGVSSLLASSLDLEATARNAVRLPVPHLATAALLALRDAGGPRTWFFHVDADRGAAGRGALAAGPLGEITSVTRALRTGRVAICRPADPSWPSALRAVLPGALEVTLPIAGLDEPLGTLTLFAPGDARVAAPEGLVLAEELARRLAIAVENARLYQSAEQAVRARDDFFAIASHELKTPLTPLRLQIQALERLALRGELSTMPPDRLARMVHGAEAQIVRIVALIDRLLDLTRIRANRFRLDTAPMDLAATVRAIAEQHGGEIVEGGGRLSVDATAPVYGTWDRLRVEQVVTNLLTNAAKYAPGAPVAIRVERHAHRARLEVRDEGPGIPATDQARLFRPFERAAQASYTTGLGLGLFIVRQIVEAHGGTVTLQSEPGRGTSFVVELPCATPARA